MGKVYFDYAACAPVCKSVIENIQELIEKWYNPSSANEISMGLMAEIEEVRNKVAKVINADSDEIFFVSSGSEANALAIDGFLKANKEYYYRVVASNIEHSSILENPNVTNYIECDEFGRISPEALNGYKKCLFCVNYANSEIGAVNSIKRIANVAHKNNGYLLTDATAAFGKIPIDVKADGVDMLTAAGQKIGSLKGVAFIYIKKGIRVNSIVHGHQETGMRGSTLNYMAIKSLGYAIDEVYKRSLVEIMNLRNYLERTLISDCSNITVNGHGIMRLPNILNICIHDISIDSQQLVALLDESGFVVSAGSACNAGSNTPSHVLKAIGLSDEDANHSIRISLGEQNTKEEVDAFIECLKSIIDMYKSV